MGAVATSLVIEQAGVLYPFWQRPCAKRDDAKGAAAAGLPRCATDRGGFAGLTYRKDYIVGACGVRTQEGKRGEEIA